MTPQTSQTHGVDSISSSACLPENEFLSFGVFQHPDGKQQKETGRHHGAYGAASVVDGCV